MRDVAFVASLVLAAANASVDSHGFVAGTQIGRVRMGCVLCAGLGGGCPRHGSYLRYPGSEVFARDASCVRDLAGGARGTVTTFDMRDGKEAKEGKEKEKKPGPPPSDRPTREIERDGLSPEQLVMAAML